MLRHRVTAAMREFLDGEGFVDVETPVLTRSTPEGARDFLVPSRQQQGSFYALPQSPQLFKQLLMVAGFERYYQVARCFRDESTRADRQAEFTQLDIEMSFVDGRRRDRRQRTAAGARLRARRAARRSSSPMQRMCYDEAMDRFGTDRPDLRFGLELVDLGDALRETEFKVFRSVLEGGGSIRGHQRRPPRDAALGARRADLPRPGAGREGAGLGLSRGRRLALADGEVPQRGGAGRPQPAARRRGGRPAAARRRRARGDRCGAGADAARPGRALRPDRRGRAPPGLDRRLAADGVERRASSAGTRCTTRSRRRPESSTRRIPAPRGHRPTTWSGTARSLAAARSASTAPTSPAGRSSPRSGSMPRPPRRASASCSRRCATGRRRTAASPTASTASSSGSPAPRRSAT